jgi:peptidoglycan/xylan/chitin deacetylase (PgdA/CDA1 family)
MAEFLKRGFTRFSVALRRALGDRSRGAPAILTYHRVVPPSPGLPRVEGDVDPATFREQIVGMRRLGYRFVRLADMLEAHETGGSLPPQSVAITFDDGFHCVHRWALPILAELEAPATVFLATAYMDSAAPFPFDPWAQRYWQRTPSEVWRPLTWDECRALRDSGWFELGVHTDTHQDFRDRPTAFLADLRASVVSLGSRFTVDRPTFAFPWGKRHCGFAGGNLTAAARRAGVRCALSTESECIDLARSPFEWGRFTACHWDNSATLGAKLGGWYGWGPKLAAALRLALGSRFSSGAAFFSGSSNKSATVLE